MNFSITVEIQASPETVWGVLREIKRWPEWTPTVKSIRRLDNGPLAVGSRARIRQPRLPPADWRVTELEEGRSFTWVTGSPGLRVTARHWIEPHASGSGALSQGETKKPDAIAAGFLNVQLRNWRRKSSASVSG